MQKYKIKLLKGESRTISILKPAFYKCYWPGDASENFMPEDEMRGKGFVPDASDREPRRMRDDVTGSLIIDEQHLFDTFRLLRNPIQSLEVITIQNHGTRK